MSSANAEPFPNTPGCDYYLVTEQGEEGRALAVVEGDSLTEAAVLVDAVRRLLGIPADACVTLEPIGVLPCDVPVFRVPYLRSLQSTAVLEVQRSGTSLH